MPSKKRPSTFALSSIDSFLPTCELPESRNVTWAPSSCAAVSNAQRVLVEVFSNRSTIFFPSSARPHIPARFFALRSRARSSRYLISSGLKSIRVRKDLPFKFTAISSNSFLHTIMHIINILYSNYLSTAAGSESLTITRQAAKLLFELLLRKYFSRGRAACSCSAGRRALCSVPSLVLRAFLYRAPGARGS